MLLHYFPYLPASKYKNMLLTLVIGLFLSSFLNSLSFDRFDVSNTRMYSMYESVRVYMSETTLPQKSMTTLLLHSELQRAC